MEGIGYAEVSAICTDIVGRCIAFLQSTREQCTRNRRKFSPQTKITGRAEKKVIHGLMARLMEFEGAEDYLDADYSLESANDLVWLIHVVSAVLLGTGE